MNRTMNGINRGLLLVAFVAAFVAGADDIDKMDYTGSSPITCTSGLRPFDPNLHKNTYRVGVHAIRGFEAAEREYTKGFSEYLTMTAGQRFDPPIKFEMVPMTFEDIFVTAKSEEMDFMFANPSVFTCIGVEEGASELATIVSRLTVRGHTFDMDVFGGVMATRWDNDDINDIEDLKDKVIAAGSISMIMAGQLQFHEMEKAGVSYVMGPKQVIMTYNQFDIVHGIINGDFDVGFVRTDTIERTTYEDGTVVDPDLFKIIEPKIYVMEDGNLFPFLHSTPVYPEWPFAALSHVPEDVAEEVQQAILAIRKHAETGQKLQDCRAEFDNKTCDSLAFPKDFDPSARCDTTKELAELAVEATLAGAFSGFRPARNYFEPRSMLQDAGFMKKDARGNWYCTRASSLYDGIDCPEGHYKRSKREFDEGCSRVGLKCKEGYDCFCKPCVKAFEVDVYPIHEGYIDTRLTSGDFGTDLSGCDKMSLCGSVEQRKIQTFRVFDNRKREDAELTAIIHVGRETKDVHVARHSNISWAYEFNVSEPVIGVEMIEIFIDGKQIPESPIRVQVIGRDCDSDYGEYSRRRADEQGVCICENGTVEIAEKCVSSVIFFVVVALVLFGATMEIFYAYLHYKKRQGDNVWLVNVDELHFTEPLEIIGQGAFGVVLLAEYRGTKVAVKRVIPANKGSRSGSRDTSTLNTRDSRDSKGPSVDVEAPTASSGSVPVERESGKEIKLKGSGPAPSRNNSFASSDVDRKGTASEEDLLDMFANNNSYSMGQDRGWFRSFCPFFPQIKKRGRDRILGSHTSVASSTSMGWHCLPRCDSQTKQKEEFVVEMRLLSRLRHPCITTVMGAVISPVHEPMLVMEYMDYGSLYDLLRNDTMFLSGEIILQIVRDITQGMRYLHSSKPPILHGDLKAKNILVDSRFRAKVCDFGLSEKKKHGIQGTPLWMAPEYLRGKTDYNGQCDVYSLGLIFYEIYARKDPYEGEDLKEVLRRICDPRVNKRPPVPESCPPKMADIMKRCWSPDPFFRPNAKDLDLLLMDMSIQDVEPRDKNQQNGKTVAKKERASGDMLYDLFPRHIADALNAGQKVEPESHELVSAVYSDIVGFTDISGTFTPLKVSQMLDRLYLCFDTLAREHGVFKVETIGDAYVGVTNLEGTMDGDHVKRIANFALGLIATKILIDEDDPDRGCVQIRVGFHSGPVVSNVIGSLNPRYGLFGDTMSIAAKMESNSQKGRVLCTEKSALLLQQQAPEISVVKRGKISVNGKKMVTYWVGSSGDQELSKHASFSEHSVSAAAPNFSPPKPMLS